MWLMSLPTRLLILGASLEFICFTEDWKPSCCMQCACSLKHSCCGNAYFLCICCKAQPQYCRQSVTVKLLEDAILADDKQNCMEATQIELCRKLQSLAAWTLQEIWSVSQTHVAT